MAWTKNVQSAIDNLRRLRNELHETFTERNTVIDLLSLSLVCQEHLLMLGPPGTAKTDIVRHFSSMLDASMFSYLLTRFTEPAEIFGPIDLEQFNQGKYRIRTDRMLPACSVAFLDEVFHGSSAILNTLLTLVHERTFFNGAVMEPVPLISVIGASNELPADATLRAFADRFILRCEVQPVSDGRLEQLLEMGERLDHERMKEQSRAQRGEVVKRVPLTNEQDMRILGASVPEVDLSAVRSTYAQLIRELRAEGVQLSDRRVVKGQRLVAAAAVSRGAQQAQLVDFWPLRHIWGVAEEAEVYRNLVDKLGGAAIDRETTQRQASLIRDDIGLLNERIAILKGETAIGAHLMALGRLRREVVREHANDVELLRQVDQAIESAMVRLQAGVRAHV